jgi:hypothetical protein
VTVDALGSMSDCQDDAVLGEDRIGIELWLKLFENLGPLRPAESVAGMVVKKHQLASPVVMYFAAVGK